MIAAAEKLLGEVRSPTRRSWIARFMSGMDNYVMRKFMLERHPGTYASVIKAWKERGLM